jgi:MBG domain
MATGTGSKKRGRRTLIFLAAVVTLAFGAVSASAAELITAEVTATVNDVTVTQGGSVTSTINVSANGQLACSVTAANPATATVDTSFSLSAAGSLTASSPSSAMRFYTGGGPSGNCPVAWDGSPTPYAVSATFSAAAGTPVGTYTVTLSEGAGTTDESNPNSNGGKLGDTSATQITLHVVAPSKQSQTITFPAISGKTFGVADFDPGATASSGLPVAYSATGNCSILSGNVHVTGAGSCSVTANQGGNTTYFAAAPVTQGFSIAKSDQTVSFAPGTVPFSAPYNGIFTPAAGASSGLLPSVAVSGACTRDPITGVVRITSGVGTCTVTASQAGDANYNSASATAGVTAAKASQTIAFGPLGGKTYGDGDFTVSASASSGLAVSFAASGSCTISASTVQISGAGSCSITASQAGNDDYEPASDVTQSFSIAQRAQTITFDPLPNKTYGDAAFTVGATGGGSGNPLTFTSSGKCTVTGNTVAIEGAGSCAVTADQAGNADYAAAESVSRSFEIAKGSATLSLSNLNQTYDGSPREVAVTTTPAGLSGVSVTYDSSATPPTDAGDYGVVASLDNENYAAAPASGTLHVEKASQTISFTPPSGLTYGDADTLLSAAAPGGAVSFDLSPGTVCTFAAGSLHIVGAGTCDITASQGGSTNYQAAPDVIEHMSIAKAHATLALSDLAKVYNGSPQGVTVTTTPEALDGVSVTYDGASAEPTNAGSYAVVAMLDNPNYEAAGESGTLIIDKAPQTISFATLAERTYGDADFDVGASGGGSGNPVTFSAAGTCTVSGATVSINGAGSCTITAHQAGDGNYHAADPVARSFGIAKAHATLSLSNLNQTYGGSPIHVSVATSPVGLTGVHVTYDGSATAPTNAGTYAVLASLENANYEAADASGMLVVAKAHATLALAGLNQTYDGLPREVTVTTDPLGLPGVSVTYDGSATAPTNAGSYAVVATLDNPNYEGPDATDTLVVAKANQTISFAALPDKTYLDPPFAVNATGGGSGNPVTFSVGAGDNCTISGNTVTITGAGSCTVTADENGNANYLAAPSVGRTFAITKANQSVTFSLPPEKKLGDPDFGVTATSSSGLPVAFGSSSPTVCAVSGNVIHILGVGICTIVASQAGNADYNPASQSRSLGVTYVWTGFFQPIDNGVMNIAKAGSTIPVKFSLGGDRGLAILAPGYPQSGSISCAADSVEAAIEEYATATVSGLKYDPSANQYIYNWKTATTFAGSCRQLIVKLADGTYHRADFRFAR